MAPHMSFKSSIVWGLVLTLWSPPARSAERAFESWDDFYREFIRSNTQEVLTSLQPRRKGGEQVSRDFEFGDQMLRLFNPSTRTLRLNGKSLRVDMDWPEPGEEKIDLSGALAFTYPGTELLACVQANFQGLGMSGRFQNVRQLTLVFRAENPRGRARAMRVTGYGFDCRGVYRGGDGWQLTQIVEGETDNGKVLKRWRLGEKAPIRLAETVTFRVTDDGKILTPDEQRP